MTLQKLIILALFAVPSFGAYNHARPIIINHTKIPNTDQTNFPMTVIGQFQFLAVQANGGGVTNSSGYDIIFTADSGCTTKLNFERNLWDDNTGQSEFHVEVPTLSHSTDTTIYLCYGNSAITTDQQSSPWDTNFIDVNHFHDGSSLTVSDSTSHLTFTNSGSPSAMSGVIGGAALLNNGGNSHSDAITSGSSTDLATSGPKTFEAWINPTALQNADPLPSGLLAYGKSGYPEIYTMQLRNYNSWGVDSAASFSIYDGTNFQIVQGPPVVPGSWYHVVGVVDSSHVLLYVNGTQQGSISIGTGPATGDSTYSLAIGQDITDSDPSSFFNGAIDEIRISNTARSADWISAEYANENSPDTFYTVGPITANSSNIKNVGIQPTATQAVITFTAPSGYTPGSCGISASESPSMDAPVIDVDTGKFANSNMASRPGTVIKGQTVSFILGHRYAAQYATVGDTTVAYSRALQQGTQHSLLISCGSDEYDTTFTTSTISVGNTHEEGIPADPTVPGRPAWPTLLSDIKCVGFSGPCTRRDTKFIDPQEGTLGEPLVLPGDNIYDDHNATHNFWMALPLGAGWTVGSGFTGGSANATITGSASKLAIIGMDDGEAFNNNRSSPAGPTQYWNPAGLQFNFNASISNSACNGTNTSDDCKVELCVTLDGVVCAANAQTYEQVVSNSLSSYTIGSGSAYDDLQKPGKPTWSHMQTAPHYTGVSCAGSNISIPIGSTGDIEAVGISFNVGSWVVTDSGAHQVTSIQNGLNFTVADTPGTCTYLHVSNFGLLVWKKTTTADTLTLGSPSLKDLAATDTIPQINSGYIGAPIQITMANGDPGAIIRPGQGMYAIDLINGHTEPFASVDVNNSLGSGQNNPMDNNGDIWFMANDTSLSKAHYVGDYSKPVYRDGNGAQIRVPLWEWNMGTWLFQCGNSGVNTQCFNLTQVTQSGSPLSVLVAAFDPSFSTTPFSTWDFNGIEDGILNINARWTGTSNQSYMAWHIVFDPNATCNVNGTLNPDGTCQSGTYGAGCIGSVTSPANGCVVAARRTWMSPGARWTLDKGSIPILRAGWVIDQSPASTGGGSGGGGPFVTNEVGTFSTVTCPSSYSSYTCVQLTVDGSPFDLGDSNAGNGTRSRAWMGPIDVGDWALLGQNLPANPLPNWPNPFPLLEVAQVSGNTLTLACIHSSQCPTNNTANQQLYFVTNYPGTYPPWCCNGFGFGAFIYWNWKKDPHGLNANGDTIITEYSAVQGHGFMVNGVGSQATVNVSLQPLCTDPQGNCYNNRNYQGMTDSEMVNAMADQAGNRQSGVVAFSTTFSGIKAFNGAGGSNNIQLHPDFEGLSNKSGVPGLALDGRPWMGIYGAPYTSQVTLVGTTVYKIAQAFSSTLHLKIWDLQGYAGSHILRNITAPGSSITDGEGGYYTMCYALLAGECWSGSLAGEVYVNIPYYLGGINTSSGSACYTPGGEATGWSDLYLGDDLCVFDAGVQNSHTRFNLTGFDSQGWAQQSLGHGMLSGRADIFHSIHPATSILNSNYPNWYWWNMENWDTKFGTMLLKAPRFDPDSNSTARPFFASVNMQVNVPAGANGAGVEIAYDEYGGFCSPNRAEACVTAGSTVDQTTPWYWESSETGSYAPLSCTHGMACTVAVPVLWGHVAKLRPVYFSGSTIVGRGQTEVIPVQ